MAIRNNPGTISSNLRFAYDIADTRNSYIGEPTTNLASFDITSHTLNTDTPAQIVSTTNSSEATYRGRLSRKLSILSGYWNAYFYGYNTGVSSTKFAVSYKVKVSSGAHPSTIIGGGYIYGSAGTFFPSPSFTYLEDGWYQATMLYSGTSMTLNSLTGMNGNGPGVIYITDYQAEAKDHSTPFAGVAGTRSSTQGLLDISGYNTSMDISNMSYNSNASIYFDGVNDEFHPTTVHSYLSSSALEVVFNYTGNIGGYKTIFGYRHNSGYSSPTIGSIYLSDDRLKTSVITAAEVYRQTTSSTTISNNTTYHVVFNKNTVAGIMDVYINGTLDSSQTFNAATYGQWSSPGSYIGSNDLDIGKSTNSNTGQGWGSDFFAGTIPIAKIYGNVLSADQIQQNYLAYKKRFNI